MNIGRQFLAVSNITLCTCLLLGFGSPFFPCKDTGTQNAAARHHRARQEDEGPQQGPGDWRYGTTQAADGDKVASPKRMPPLPPPRPELNLSFLEFCLAFWVDWRCLLARCCSRLPAVGSSRNTRNTRIKTLEYFKIFCLLFSPSLRFSDLAFSIFSRLLVCLLEHPEFFRSPVRPVAVESSVKEACARMVT